MNCYTFKENISLFLDGELKQKLRSEFIEHRDQCKDCLNDLSDFEIMIQKLPSISSLTTSENFMQKLHQKIDVYENAKPPIILRLKNAHIFGMELPSALGMAAALMLVVGASYMLFQGDQLPELNLKQLASKQEQSQNQLQNIRIVEGENYVADQDSSKDEDNTFEGPIKLVKGK